VVYPAINSDSASVRSKGIREVSRKKVTITKGSIGKKHIKLYLHLNCQVEIVSKENDSARMVMHKTKNVNKISRFTPIITTREEDIIAYLLLEVYPTSTKRYENPVEIMQRNSILYSISQIDKLGIQTILAQKR
jgi:hypothetical protein